MTTELDMSGPIEFFFSLMTMIRVDILEKFTLPFLNISYWDFCISMAAASIVVAGCIAVVRFGGLHGGHFGRGYYNAQKQPSEAHTGASASQRRSMEQRNNSSHSVDTSSYSSAPLANGKPFRR